MQRLAMNAVLDVWECKNVGSCLERWREFLRTGAVVLQKAQAVAVTINYIKSGNSMVTILH